MAQVDLTQEPGGGPRVSADHLQEIITTQAALASAEFDLEQFMQLVVERVQVLTGATGAVVELVENDEIVYRAAGGTVAPYVGLRIAREGSLSGRCVAEGQILIANDTSNDPRVNRAACEKVQAASMVVVPLFQRGKAVGVVKIVSRTTFAFGDVEIETLRLMAGLLGGALGQQIEIDERRQREDGLRHAAQTDSLTGLPNRMLFTDRLAQSVLRSSRQKGMLVLMYLDLDGFKRVNDTLGHGAGDTLLQAVAGRLRLLVRQSDTVARLGGDEFAVIAEDFPDPEPIRRMAAAIVEGMRQPFVLPAGEPAHIGVSIGIATAAGGGTEAGTLIKAADDALYRVKGRGGHGFELVELPAQPPQPEHRHSSARS